MFKKVIVIDGKGHMLGRLASYVAKQALSGQRIVVVRCEAINISGSLFRNKIKFHEFLNKHLLTNPRRTFTHYKAPSRILWRSIRGMVKHKTPKGAIAMGNLKLIEGVPAPYDTMKRMVIPDALRCVKLTSFRKFCKIGDLSGRIGWNSGELIAKLEDKRRERAAAWHKRRVEKAQTTRKAKNSGEIAKIRKQLAEFGY